jgi:hypothetical protein
MEQSSSWETESRSAGQRSEFLIYIYNTLSVKYEAKEIGSKHKCEIGCSTVYPYV